MHQRGGRKLTEFVSLKIEKRRYHPDCNSDKGLKVYTFLESDMQLLKHEGAREITL